MEHIRITTHRRFSVKFYIIFKNKVKIQDHAKVLHLLRSNDSHTYGFEMHINIKDTDGCLHFNKEDFDKYVVEKCKDSPDYKDHLEAARNSFIFDIDGGELYIADVETYVDPLYESILIK